MRFFKSGIQWINPLSPISLYQDFSKKSGSPAAPLATPTPATPATAATAEVVQAEQDVRRQALKKKGFAATYLAGDDGGYFPGNGTPSPAGQSNNPKLGGAGA